MRLNVDDEFLEICKMIVKEGKNENEWNEIESDDMFQTENYSGGFDSIERAFCFSFFEKNNKEFWFQLTLEEIISVVNKEVTSFELREAEI